MAKRVKRGKKRGSAKKRVARKRTSRPALKKMVKMEIARQVENKSLQHYDYDQRLYTIGNASFGTDNIISLGPDGVGLVMNQGTGAGQRLGNQVRTKKLSFKGSLVCLPYDATFNPQPQPLMVKLWIFYDKTDPTVQPAVASNNDFFQNGNSAKGFQGDLTDQWSPVNTDRYRVLTTRSFKLGFASAANLGQVTSYQSFANNDYKLNCNFSLDLTKYYPKIVKFNDGLTAPTSRGLWAMFTYAPANGGVLPGTLYCAGLQWMQNFVFEDA